MEVSHLHIVHLHTYPGGESDLRRLGWSRILGPTERVLKLFGGPVQTLPWLSWRARGHLPHNTNVVQTQSRSWPAQFGKKRTQMELT